MVEVNLVPAAVEMGGRNNLFIRLSRWGNTSVGMATVVIVITVEVDCWKWQRRMISFYKFSVLDIFIGRMWWCPLWHNSQAVLFVHNL